MKRHLLLCLACVALSGCGLPYWTTTVIKVQSVECPAKVVIDDSVLELLSKSRGEDDMETLWCNLASAKVSEDTKRFICYDNNGRCESVHDYVADWKSDEDKDRSDLRPYSVADICKRIAEKKSLDGLFDLLHD